MIIFSFDFILRLVSFLLFIYWWVYWQITERIAYREKPKKNPTSSYLEGLLRHGTLMLLEGVLAVQVAGISLFSVQASPSLHLCLQFIGFLLIVVGVSIAISARKTLGNNWSHAFEYQVKQKQELVTTGVYKYIRHPIYTGLLLAFFGGEILVHSYLILIGFILLVFALQQMKREEKLLTKHFGSAYTQYKKHSKMFLPFLW